MTTNQVELSESERALLSYAIHDAIHSYREMLSICIEKGNGYCAKIFKERIEQAEALDQLIEDAESVVIDKGDPEQPKRVMANTFDFTINAERVTYTPWTNGYAVGYHCKHQDGREEYIYLNPSSDDSDEVPSVFVYQGTEGRPAYDGVRDYYVPFEENK